MKQLSDIFCKNEHSSATTLLLLGVGEQATRHSIGCEGFLGWWPREDDKIPVGTSEGYNQLLKLLMQKQRHDIASLATYILHRMRFYEVASRYEFAVLRVLGGFSSVGNVMSVTMDMLASAKLQLKKLFKLINSSALVEDPSPVACTSRSLILGEMDGLLSYKATSRLITLSNCRFSNWDIDSHLLFLLKNDLLPDEGVSLWKNGMPMLSAFRQLAVGTLLGPEKEREINWYLQAGHKEKLIGQLTAMLHKIAEIVLHCAISALVVIQDMLRIFIMRMACVHADSAAILLRPMILWIDEWLSESSSLTDTDAYKVCRLLEFVASLLEHPRAKPILLSEGAIQMISKVLKSSADVFNLDAKQFLEDRISTQLIQDLLGDREKLVQLLEQHPKLMQMLQDKLHG